MYIFGRYTGKVYVATHSGYKHFQSGKLTFYISALTTIFLASLSDCLKATNGKELFWRSCTNVPKQAPVIKHRLDFASKIICVGYLDESWPHSAASAFCSTWCKVTRENVWATNFPPLQPPLLCPPSLKVYKPLFPQTQRKTLTISASSHHKYPGIAYLSWLEFLPCIWWSVPKQWSNSAHPLDHLSSLAYGIPS